MHIIYLFIYFSFVKKITLFSSQLFDKIFWEVLLLNQVSTVSDHLEKDFGSLSLENCLDLILT